MEHAVSRNLIPAPGVQLGLTSVGRSDTMPGHRFGPGFLISPNQQTDYQADEIAP